jgi:hypothetical protein
MRAKSESIILADNSLGVHYGNVMMGDQIALGAPAAMVAYASTFEVSPRLFDLNLFKFGNSFEGHRSLAYTCWLKGVRVEPLPIKRLPFAETRPLSVAAIEEAIKADAVGRNDLWDQRLLEAIQADGRAVSRS